MTQVRLQNHRIRFSLRNLTPGVDNVRNDVVFSPKLRRAVLASAAVLITKQASALKFVAPHNAADLTQARDEFERAGQNVLQNAVVQAKAADNPQVDYLAQVALVKMMRNAIGDAFEGFLQRIKEEIRNQEYQPAALQERALELRAAVTGVQQNRKRILNAAGRELAGWLGDLQSNHLAPLRQSTFKPGELLPEELFANPLLFADLPPDSAFMQENYVLLGQRFEDACNYDNFLFIFTNLLDKLLAGEESSGADRKGAASASEPPDARERSINEWIKNTSNLDLLLNPGLSRNRMNALKEQKAPREAQRALKRRAAAQERRLDFIYRHLKRAGQMQKIAATYEIEPLLAAYCPPLEPQQLLQFVLNRRKRKPITLQLKRLHLLYGRGFSTLPLRRVAGRIKRLPARKKKAHLLHFLTQFCRYHRDLENFRLLQEAMNGVNLLEDEKSITLSRANHTLYEFLQPEELAEGERPIRHHVILKADVRGSTAITGQMKKRGLNPASYFSLNFFDPISAILDQYHAEKVFIEGDAAILAIFERSGGANEGYSVARACGLAAHILRIVQRYNRRIKQYRLPALELGVGVSYQRGEPTYLFDGDAKIMISPAINMADRMSSCDRALRAQLIKTRRRFPLYVFQMGLQGNAGEPSQAVICRYNVNGIELAPEGFKKLQQEISLELVEERIPELQPERLRLYTGLFPTATQKFRRLIIREAAIPVVDPDDLYVIRMTGRRYYEICTHPLLFERFRDADRKVKSGSAMEA